MKATILKNEYTGKIAQNRREKSFTSQLTLIAPGATRLKEIASARFYYTGSRVYCCVWINSESGVHIAGGGFAGGYGYHKSSAALQAALNNAGVALDEAINGRGDGAMDSALLAIAEALGEHGAQVFHAHA